MCQLHVKVLRIKYKFYKRDDCIGVRSRNVNLLKILQSEVIGNNMTQYLKKVSFVCSNKLWWSNCRMCNEHAFYCHSGMYPS